MSLDRELHNSVEILPGRLYYVALSAVPSPAQSTQKHFFSIDNELVYWNFFLDFGPLNLGQLYRFCVIVNTKLSDSRLKDKVLYYYSSSHPHKRANAVFLMTAWALLCLDKSPDEAFKPFKGVAPFPPWHDATPTSCTFNLTIMDTIRGLHKARECNFFDFKNFNIEEYEHYEKVENGDFNWCLNGKFIAFAGPHAVREMGAGGYQTLCPDDYISYFKRKNVTLVVRLNKKYYDAKKFTSQGIDHLDLYFLDGSNPPDAILAKFLSKSEETPGAVAVHCKAGLGRTGCCIGAYIMKHYRFTAEELIGWLRVVRPGSIIGPQQQFMKELQPRMWREGELYRTRANPSPRRRQEGERDAAVGSLTAKLNGMSTRASESAAAPPSPSAAVRDSRPSTRERAYSAESRPSGLLRYSSSSSQGVRGDGGAAKQGSETDAVETQGDQLRLRRQQMKAAEPPPAAHHSPSAYSTRNLFSSGGVGLMVQGRDSQSRDGGQSKVSAPAGINSPGSPSRRSTLGTFLSNWAK